MDVIDDLTNVGLYALDYLGFDVNNLGRLFHPLPVRQNNIRHRSIVRRIGSRLPLKPAHRIQVQNVLLGRPDVTTDNESIYSELSYVSSGGDNLVWVEEDLGNNCIMVRPRDKFRSESPDLHIDADISTDMFDPVRVIQCERTSTPFDMSMGSVSTVSTVDPFTQQKISALEDELATLRSQIALLIKDQEKSKRLSVDGIEIPCPPPSCPPPPPPPPPPLPPANMSFFKASKSGKSLSELIKENIGNLGSVSDTHQEKVSGPPDMAEVLKGLGTVKLRAVQRSPGGTPLRTEKPRLSDSQDPATLIALALKKKFAGRVLHSPYSPYSPESEENEYDSPEKHSAPFGQHVLKKTRTRSILFQEQRKSASPLQERNH